MIRIVGTSLPLFITVGTHDRRKVADSSLVDDDETARRLIAAWKTFPFIASLIPMHSWLPNTSHRVYYLTDDCNAAAIGNEGLACCCFHALCGMFGV